MTLYLLQASACMILLYGIYHVLYSKLTFFGSNRGYLLSALILSLIIPWVAPYLTLTFSEPPVMHWNYIYHYEMLPVITQENTNLDNRNLLLSCLYVIYWIGVVFVLSKLSYGLYKIYTYYKNGQKKTIHNVPFVETEAVHLPFSFMNKVFVSKHVPLTQDIATILDHEVVHIRQWHSIDILVTEVVQALFWFNPIVVLYKQSLKQAHEFLADKAVAEKMSPSHYSLLLLSQKQIGLELALTHSFFNSLIKKRIDMMTHHKSPRQAMWKYLAIFPAVALLFFFFSSCEVKEEVSSNVEESTSLLKSPPPPPPPAPLSLLLENFSEFAQRSGIDHPNPLLILDGKIIQPADLKGDVSNIKSMRVGSAKSCNMSEWSHKYGDKAAHGVIELFTQGEDLINAKRDGDVYKVVEEMPRFPGCEHISNSEERKKCADIAMLTYISENIKYPESAKSKGVEGTVVVQFVVNTDGTLSDSNIVRDIGEGCGQVAADIIEQMNTENLRWIPGKQGGKTVNVMITLPVKFKLEG